MRALASVLFDMTILLLLLLFVVCVLGFEKRFVDFGIDSVADALDPFITTAEALRDDIGLTEAEVAAFHKQCKVARTLSAVFF